MPSQPLLLLRLLLLLLHHSSSSSSSYYYYIPTTTAPTTVEQAGQESHNRIAGVDVNANGSNFPFPSFELFQFFSV